MKRLLLLICANGMRLTNPGAQPVVSRVIDVGNIRAPLQNHGDMWAPPDSNSAGCRFPKDSGRVQGYRAAVWLSGTDASGTLRTVGQTYRDDGEDWFPGPLDVAGESDASLQSAWNKVWRVDRSDLDKFLTTGPLAAADIPTQILEWPTRGNVSAKGADGAPLVGNMVPGRQYAPFVDVDGNGTYDATAGDYPALRGDQMLWTVSNDVGGLKTMSGTQSIGVEMTVTAWAYSHGTVADNIVFYEFQMANRGSTTMSSFRSAFWSDIDLSYGFDDYAGFDSSKRLGYVYNAVSDVAPTNDVAGVKALWLEGDMPGSRTPVGSFTITKMGGGSPPAFHDPTVGVEFDHLMNSRLRDGSPIPGGGRYIYTGDPTVPGSESECGLLTVPSDRRLIVASEDFIFLPAGGAAKMAVAFLVAPNAGSCGSLDLSTLLATADTAQALYDSPPPFVPNSIHGAGELAVSLSPNPAHNSVELNLPSGTVGVDVRVEIVSADGRVLQVPMQRNARRIWLDISSVPSGVYLLRASAHGLGSTIRFTKQ